MTLRRSLRPQILRLVLEAGRDTARCVYCGQPCSSLTCYEHRGLERADPHLYLYVPEHGRQRYALGCRCLVCRIGEATHRRDSREALEARRRLTAALASRPVIAGPDSRPCA